MTTDEAIEMVKAKLECMTRDVSGRDSDCINHRCDECPLNYEQGNMGEQKEWLKMSIEALEQESKKCVKSKKSTSNNGFPYFMAEFTEDDLEQSRKNVTDSD